MLIGTSAVRAPNAKDGAVQNVASPIRTNSEPISDVFGTGVPQLTQAYLETSISDVSDDCARRSRTSVMASEVTASRMTLMP